MFLDSVRWQSGDVNNPGNGLSVLFTRDYLNISVREDKQAAISLSNEQLQDIVRAYKHNCMHIFHSDPGLET